MLGVGAGVIARVLFEAPWESFHPQLLSPTNEHDILVDSDNQTSGLREHSPAPDPQRPARPVDEWATAPPLPLDQSALFAQEEVLEPITIPTRFAAKYLWSPSALGTESAEKPISPPGAFSTNHIILPPGLLAEANDALFTALSISTQLASVHPKTPPLPPPLLVQPPAGVNMQWSPPPSPPRIHSPLPGSNIPTEPIVTIFAPFNNATSAVDAIVRDIGQSQQADVLVIDALTLAEGEAGPLGPGMFARWCMPSPF